MEEVLEKIKAFNNITSNDHDFHLTVWTQMAIKAIYNYLNNRHYTDEIILKKFPEAIMLIVSKAYASAMENGGTGTGSSSSKGGIKKITQGARSIEYYQETTSTSTQTIASSKDLDPFDIVNNSQLKTLLPMPFIRTNY